MSRIEYFYPEEINRETLQLRRALFITPSQIIFTSELPMLLTDDEVRDLDDHLHRLWRRAWQRHRDKRQREMLADRYPIVRKELESWAAYEANCKARGVNPQISEWRKLGN